MAADRAIDAPAIDVEVRARTSGSRRPTHVRAGETVGSSSRTTTRSSTTGRSRALANVDAGARPGQTQRIRFTIDEPGTYVVECTVEGHAEAGMVGTLVVEAAD